jgi:hypothetical protein
MNNPTDKLIDIENRARQRDRRANGFPAGRVCDLQMWFTFHYGEQLPEDDAGRDDFYILAQHIARLNGRVVENICRYAKKWAPWLSPAELDRIISLAQDSSRHWTADQLGVKLGLPDHVRTMLGSQNVTHNSAHTCATEKSQERNGQDSDAHTRANDVAQVRANESKSIDAHLCQR